MTTKGASQDNATEIERFGIEHIPLEERHGTAGRTFTLWFAANLTIADYVIGVLTTEVFGLNLMQSIPVLLLGNLLGGLVLGLSTAMGPKLGYPQMFTSRSSFGRKGNYLPGGLNWISTVGWFTVNTILGALAIQAIFPGSNYFAAATLLVVVQVLIAIYGHDFIHVFEKWMSVVLGVIFLVVFILALPQLGHAVSIPASASGSSILGAVGTVLAVAFSYIMSWSPYASDYSRYLPEQTSRAKVAIYSLAGGAIASFAIEVIGAIVGLLTGSADYFVALRNFSGSIGYVILVALVLGAIAANALNIYTNSLSALVLDVKARRWITVSFGGAVGLILAALLGGSFEQFFENFLLILDYWITPWLAIILVDNYVLRRTSSASCRESRSVEWGTLGVYLFSILASVPFMSPPTSLGPSVGFLNGWFGGADFSYFISFGIAAVLYFALRRGTAKKSVSVSQG
ncbi:MAG TPA: cytosine permease [Nitrososphaerales archaeon]|nr:cytosine permease [Nitrososphaerales archaeon]